MEKEKNNKFKRLEKDELYKISAGAAPGPDYPMGVYERAVYAVFDYFAGLKNK